MEIDNLVVVDPKKAAAPSIDISVDLSASCRVELQLGAPHHQRICRQFSLLLPYTMITLAATSAPAMYMMKMMSDHQHMHPLKAAAAMMSPPLLINNYHDSSCSSSSSSSSSSHQSYCSCFLIYLLTSKVKR